MLAFPKEANTPPVVGEYGYYHQKKNNDIIKSISKFAMPHWICELTLPDGSKVDGRAVHYSLPEEKGCAPFITQHEGVISKIILLVGEFSEEV